jgi:hypothetical protein
MSRKKRRSEQDQNKKERERVAVQRSAAGKTENGLMLPAANTSSVMGLPGAASAQLLRQRAILHTQQQVGNRHVQRLLRQRQPVTGSPGQVPARRVTAPTIQRGFWSTAWDVTKGVGKGIYSVGEDIVGGAARTARGLNFFNTKEQLKIAAQNERAYNLLKDLISNRDSLHKLINFVIEHFYSKLPEERKSKIDAGIRRGMLVGGAKLVGRMVIGKQIATMLAKRLAGRIAASSAYKMLAKKLGVSAAAGATGIGIPITLLMLQGTLERAGKASDRLAKEEPELYRVLKQHDLDMAWFLVEPYLDDIKSEFNKKVEELEREADSLRATAAGALP